MDANSKMREFAKDKSKWRQAFIIFLFFMTVIIPHILITNFPSEKFENSFFHYCKLFVLCADCLFETFFILSLFLMCLVVVFYLILMCVNDTRYASKFHFISRIEKVMKAFFHKIFLFVNYFFGNKKGDRVFQYVMIGFSFGLSIAFSVMNKYIYYIFSGISLAARKNAVNSFHTSFFNYELFKISSSISNDFCIIFLSVLFICFATRKNNKYCIN